MRPGNLVLPVHGVPSKAWFRKVLEVVGRLYTFVGVEEVESCLYGGKRMRGRCHVTFDDGEHTMYEHAFPVLKELGIPATVFVSPHIIRDHANYWFQDLIALASRLGESVLKQAACEELKLGAEQVKPYALFSVYKCMTLRQIQDTIETVKRRYRIDTTVRYNLILAQLREMSESPLITIGAHTMNHPVLSNESDVDARYEIQGSVTELSEMFNRPVRYFAYPNGLPELDFGPREQQILREAGVSVAFSSAEDFVGHKTDPMSVPRGGCPRLAAESAMRMVGRLVLLPIWQPLRRMVRRGGVGDERHERQALRVQLGLPGKSVVTGTVDCSAKSLVRS